MRAMTTRTRILIGVGTVVIALIVAGFVVLAHGGDSTSEDSKPSPSATTTSETPVPEEQAQKSSRYGHFGEGAQNGADGDAPRPWSPEDKHSAETLAKDTVSTWIGDHHDPDAWRKQLKGDGNDAFATTVSGIDPSLITEGKVTGLGPTDYTSPEAKITVTTTAGDYQVGVIPGQKDPRVSYVAAKWRNR